MGGEMIVVVVGGGWGVKAALCGTDVASCRPCAEDVAVYNSDIIGGRMKELLFGLTSTLPQSLPALYRILEVGG